MKWVVVIIVVLGLLTWLCSQNAMDKEARKERKFRKWKRRQEKDRR
ncbi:MAG: hypothetical protein ABSF26_25485 [Thermoguttaceae bacterium]|jgi:type IV secretory pathway TrbD component